MRMHVTLLLRAGVICLIFKQVIMLVSRQFSSKMLHFTIIATLLAGGLCGEILHMPDYSDHPCFRDCNNASAMTCSYTFYTEKMYSMNRQCEDCMRGSTRDCFNEQCVVLDGEQKLLKVVNRLLPGPAIQICMGDTLDIMVENHFDAETIAIHWHGIHVNNKNYMDGVPYVTQCPTIPKGKFRYRFTVNQYGTYFYHAHSSPAFMDGLYGPLVVRRGNDPHQAEYDYDLIEHTIALKDWQTPQNEIAQDQYLLLHYDLTYIKTTAVLLNGFGATKHNNVPPSRFAVEPNKRYRFRLMHFGTYECPVRFSIDGHDLLIIAVDGQDIVPLKVDTISIVPGERVDFVLTANNKPQTYWLKARGDLLCHNVTGLGYVDYIGYESSPSKLTSTHESKSKIMLGYFDQFPSQHHINYDQVESLEAIDPRLRAEKADLTLYFSLLLTQYVKPQYRGIGDIVVYTATMNNITLQLSSTPLIFNTADNHPFYCNQDNKQQVCAHGEEVCNCLHLFELPVDSVVEVVFLNRRSPYPDRWVESHPMHIHGYVFSVLGMGMTNATNYYELIDNDKAGLLERNYHNAALKDTIVMPGGGYTIVRFITNNPGYWPFHCHLHLHQEDGMNVIFKVGDVDNIPANFPRCGDFE